MENVTDRRRNPFGLQPPCDRFVPGYGNANADFHVIGDHPGVHGGDRSDGPGTPFTNAAGRRLQRVLVDGGLMRAAGDPPRPGRTFLSYIHPCVPEEAATPSEAAYTDQERFVDAEIRAIAAHVLLPVGERATAYVLANYTARPAGSVTAVTGHATELRGGGWLVVPVRDPAEWTDDDERMLRTALERLLATDFRRESDLGRFLPGGDPYLVR